MFELLTNGFESIEALIPENYKMFIPLIIFIVLICIYSIFVWRFYGFLSRRDIVKLNLSKYDLSDNPRTEKFFASLFFILENIIILPIIVMIWFGIFALFILMLSKNQTVNQVIMISAALVGSVRLVSYISEELSKDLAKLFPFTLLAIFLTDSNFFSVENLIARFSQIPLFLDSILYFLVFLFSLEVALKIVYTVVSYENDSE